MPPHKRKKPKGVFIVMSSREKEFLQKNSIKSGLSMSDFVRHSIFREKGLKLRLKDINLKVNRILKICERFE
jgi:hypothetical protein